MKYLDFVFVPGVHFMKELIFKSCAASLCLALAIPILLVNQLYGSILFSLGLLTICVLKLKLFTGIAGFIFEDRISALYVSVILFSNLIFGYIIGLLLSVMDSSLYNLALMRVEHWDFSLSYFIKAFMCGIIMYVAVKLFREKNLFGIIIGVPLFLLSGFQHSIANIIISGVCCTFNPAIILAIIGNLFGSLFVWFLSREVIMKLSLKL